MKEERVPEVDRISEHVELSLTEVLGRADLEKGGLKRKSGSRLSVQREGGAQAETGTARSWPGGNAGGMSWASRGL